MWKIFVATCLVLWLHGVAGEFKRRRERRRLKRDVDKIVIKQTYGTTRRD